MQKEQNIGPNNVASVCVGLKAGFHFGEFGRVTKRWEYQGMRSLKSKLKASVYWWMRGLFWKLNQVHFLCDQNERKPIRFLLFNARACDRTGSRDWIRWSGNRPLSLKSFFKFWILCSLITHASSETKADIQSSISQWERATVNEPLKQKLHKSTEEQATFLIILFIYILNLP